MKEELKIMKEEIFSKINSKSQENEKLKTELKKLK